jgi:cation-transporting ATPase 13A1
MCLQGKHRVHVLFSGTSLVTLNETSAGDAIPHIPPPPNKGCVAYVLRTGFSSSQGALMQMIEFSQQSVHGDVRETGIALLILLVFALISAAYVMKVGLEKKEKTTHELLLKCVMIITSVIPQQFPMQMAVAVNVALMALMKASFVCLHHAIYTARS